MRKVVQHPQVHWTLKWHRVFHVFLQGLLELTRCLKSEINTKQEQYEFRFLSFIVSQIIRRFLSLTICRPLWQQTGRHPPTLWQYSCNNHIVGITKDANWMKSKREDEFDKWHYKLSPYVERSMLTSSASTKSRRAVQGLLGVYVLLWHAVQSFADILILSSHWS